MATIQKGYHSNKDYVDFINLAFNMDEYHAFPKLLPKLYKDGRESDKVTYFAIENDRIVGTVGAFPLQFHINATPFAVCGIGSVATHPETRGKGFMKALMKQAIDDMIADNIDFSVLGGRRHRYAHFGFEKCDSMMYFDITPKTVSYVAPDRCGIVMKEVTEDDSTLLDALYTAMHNRPYYTERAREDLYDILCSWHSRPYAFFKNGQLVGWAIHYLSKRQLSELGVLDLSLTQAILATATDALGALSVALPAYDHPLAEEVDILSENVNIVSNECFLVFNWQKVLSALLDLKNKTTPLANSSLTLQIKAITGNITLTLSVKNGKTSVEPTDTTPEITLSQREAEAFFFRNYSALRRKVNPQGASLLPLPLFIFEPDNV